MTCLADAGTDDTIRVTSIRAAAQGTGMGSTFEQLHFVPPKPVSKYMDALHAEIDTPQGVRSIDAAFTLAVGTTLSSNIVCTEPDPPAGGTIDAYGGLDFEVLEDVTVQITCTSEFGASMNDWYLDGPVSMMIHGAYDGSIELPAGHYELDAFLDWSSTTPHTLEITADSSGAIQLSGVECVVEMNTTSYIDIQDAISDPEGIEEGQTVSIEGSLPDCFTEYTFESSLTWTDDIGIPVQAPGFIATGEAGRSQCASGGATFTANFTLEIPHYVLWKLESIYGEDAAELEGVQLCLFELGHGCMALDTGDWQLTDGGIYDGSDVSLHFGFIPRTIRVPEDAATINDAIDLAGQHAAAIEAAGPFCNAIDDLTFTVELAPGTYMGPMQEDGPGVGIVLVARDGAGTVQMSGSSTSRCIELDSGYTTVTIKDITFSNGQATDGGAVNIGDDIDVRFMNCTFSTNHADANGGAVSVVGSTESLLTFENCLFSGNDAGSDGGAVRLEGAPIASFIDCEFTGNQAGNMGGAISWAPSSGQTVQCDGCTIQQNHSFTGGGGIMHEESGTSTLVLSDSLICKNIPENIMGSWQDEGGNVICMPCPWDLNEDGLVNGPDLTMLLGSWGECPAPEECPADINRDGVIDGADLSLLLGGWGSCP